MASRSSLILEQAAKLFAARGFGATSIDDVGAAAGVSGPAIYWHFAGKQAILATMLIDVSERLLEGGLRAVSDTASDEAAITGLIDKHVAFALSERDLIVVQSRELHHLDRADAHRVRLLQRQYVDVWVDALEDTIGGTRQGRATAVQASIGLINSTPHLRKSERPALAPMLATMARAALAAAAEHTKASR